MVFGKYRLSGVGTDVCASGEGCVGGANTKWISININKEVYINIGTRRSGNGLALARATRRGQFP